MHYETPDNVDPTHAVVKRERVIKVSTEDWADIRKRDTILRDARAWACQVPHARAVCRVKVKDGKAFILKATVKHYP